MEGGFEYSSRVEKDNEFAYGVEGQEREAFEYGLQEGFEYGGNDNKEEETTKEENKEEETTKEEEEGFVWEEENYEEEKEEESAALRYARGGTVDPLPSIVKAVQNSERSDVVGANFTGHSYRFVQEMASVFPDVVFADWNAVLQWTMELPERDEFEREERRKIFEQLFLVFGESGKEFAKALVEDSFREKKRIEPNTKFGGIAGGGKFTKHEKGTQLFKFAVDVETRKGVWIYGGQSRKDEYAMKAAGHELKAVQALVDSGVPELFFPLMATYTYLGKRVTCLSLVPIEGDSLVQGQASPKKGLTRPSKEVDGVMRTLGAALFIGEGPLGIVGPFDMEVHRGTDGKLYVIDAARLFPPQAPGKFSKPNEHMFSLLRPELVKKMETHVASDAFFPNICNRPRYAKKCVPLQTAIREVTEKMEEEIDALAEELTQGKVVLGKGEEVKPLLHSRGINMRQLLLLASKVEGNAKKILENEAICRSACWVAKREMRRSGGEVHIKSISKNNILHSMKEKYGMTVEFSRVNKTRVKELCKLKQKTVTAPPSRDKAALERVLEMQEKHLEGKERLKMIPTLLKLGDVVGNEIPITTEVYKKFSNGNTHKLSGKHPYVLALNLCEQHDPLFKVSVWFIMQRMSLETAFVAERLLGYLDQNKVENSKYIVRGFNTCLPLTMERELGKDHVMYAKAFREATGVILDSVNTMRACACADKEWDVLMESSKTKDPLEQDVLFWLAEGGAAEELKQRTVDVEAKDKYAETILLRACVGGDVETVKHLQSIGADLKAMNNAGAGCLYLSSRHGHVDLVEHLLGQGGDVNQAKEDGATSLYEACRNGHRNVVEMLISKGADVNKARKDSATPLYIACQKGRLDVVTVMLKNGTNANLAMDDGATPLYVACQKGHSDVVEVLITEGSDVNLAMENGSTPLTIACRNGHSDVVEVLVRKGSAITQAKKDGTTPLLAACRNGHSDVVEVLINNGADVNQPKDDGTTPLYISCQNGHLDVVEVLVNKGADVNKADEDGATPLYIVCYNGHLDVAKVLLKKGADINKAGKNGATPLIAACFAGQTSVVKLLVEKRCDLEPFQGKTGLEWARERGHKELVEWLEGEKVFER